MVPRSHLRPSAENPYTAWTEEQKLRPYSEAVHAVGKAGCVCVFDCRIWHSLPPNFTDKNRTMVNVRYAPKHLPLEKLVSDNQGQPPWPQMPRAVFDSLPAELRPLYEHAPLPPPEPSTEVWDL